MSEGIIAQMPDLRRRAALQAEVDRARRLYKQLQIPLDDLTDDEVVITLYTLMRESERHGITYTQFVLANLTQIGSVGIRKFVATLQWIQGQKQVEDVPESKYKTGPLPELEE